MSGGRYEYHCGSDEKRKGFFVLRDNMVRGDGTVHVTDHWTGSCWWNAKDRSLPPKLYPSIDAYTKAIRECEEKGHPDRDAEDKILDGLLSYAQSVGAVSVQAEQALREVARFMTTDTRNAMLVAELERKA